jgi:hypothetical protein
MRKATKAQAKAQAPSETFKAPPKNQADTAPTSERINLGALLSEKKSPMQNFILWLVGDTPLICHSWSQKAKLEMLKTQAGATKSAKEKRDPEQDFVDSLYRMPKKGQKDVYGFPITAVKKAILSCAHKDRGVPRSDVMQALYLSAEIVRVGPALAGAICDLPLVRIFGSEPEMREDMVRVGVGLRRTANLAYRAQFSSWGIKVIGAVNPLMVDVHQLLFLLRSAGTGIGIGDWRNEKGGWAGSFHVADLEEQREWELFAAGKGPLPQSKGGLQFAEAAE